MDDLFSDDYETIFIPAGRSLITLLTTQLNYIFTIMDEDQKRSIDFCTQKYIERILRIRNAFGDGILGYFDNKRSTSLESINVPLIKKCIKIVDNILKGRYLYVSGEERLVLDNGKFVKINYTSSGQQESVWIFNILLYQMINNIKTFVVLEEPEAHLYPEAQKDITELLAIFLNSGNSVLLTTHSPYILGSVNNLLFAQYVSRSIDQEKVYRIIEEEKIIEHCEPYFVEDGFLSRCFDDENNLIENDVIDGASSAINSVFDRLIELGNEDT